MYIGACARVAGVGKIQVRGSTWKHISGVATIPAMVEIISSIGFLQVNQLSCLILIIGATFVDMPDE